jgi:hypothetical protein
VLATHAAASIASASARAWFGVAWKTCANDSAASVASQSSSTPRIMSAMACARAGGIDRPSTSTSALSRVQSWLRTPFPRSGSWSAMIATTSMGSSFFPIFTRQQG